MLVGIFTIYAGFAIVVIGMFCVGIYVWREWRRTHSWRAGLNLQSLKAAGLLLANFPVAAAIVLTVIHLETTFFITARNLSNKTMHTFKLTAPGVDVELGPIKPGQKKKTSFQFDGDGTLRFSAVQDERQIEGTVEDYVTNGMGGRKIIEIHDGGQYAILDKKRGI